MKSSNAAANPDDAFYERFEPGYYPSYDDIVSLAMEASVQDGKALYVAEMGLNDYIYGLETAASVVQEMLDAIENDYDIRQCPVILGPLD